MKPGIPRFKGADRFCSVSFVHGDGRNLRIDARGRHVIYVQGVGELKVKVAPAATRRGSASYFGLMYAKPRSILESATVLPCVKSPPAGSPRPC